MDYDSWKLSTPEDDDPCTYVDTDIDVRVVTDKANLSLWDGVEKRDLKIHDEDTPDAWAEFHVTVDTQCPCLFDHKAKETEFDTDSIRDAVRDFVQSRDENADYEIEEYHEAA